MARSALIELFNRFIGVQIRKDKIYVNGADNLYPERIERVINNSVTAKLSVDKLQSYLVGYGFEEKTNDIFLNKRKGVTAIRALNRAAKDISYQKGVFTHVNFDVEGKCNYSDVFKFKNCRVSEEDDFDNKGYVWYSKKWSEGILDFNRSKHKNWYYPYNPDIDVINRQRKADWDLLGKKRDATPEELIRNYRGQVYFLNLDDDSVYPNSLIDPAYNDADTEHRISLFRNDRIKTGFLGANIIITPPSDNEKEGQITDEDLKNLLGAENSANILRMEVETDGDKKLSDYLHIETIKSEVDTDQFQYDEKKVEENIMGCFYGITKILVKGSDESFFGPNGDTLRVAEEVYQRNTERPRKALEELFETLYKGTELEGKFGIRTLIEIKEPVQAEETNTEEDVDTDM